MKAATIEQDIARFWSKVNKTDTCWNWVGTLHPEGYGQFTAQKKYLRAHRHSYELANGKIPTGLVIDHLCRNKACVNPDHLEAVTDRVNVVERGTGITARQARQTHCWRGHELSGENIKRYDKHPNIRVCLPCQRINSKLRWQKEVHRIAELEGQSQ